MTPITIAKIILNIVPVPRFEHDPYMEILFRLDDGLQPSIVPPAAR